MSNSPWFETSDSLPEEINSEFTVRYQVSNIKREESNLKPVSICLHDIYSYKIYRCLRENQVIIRVVSKNVNIFKSVEAVLIYILTVNSRLLMFKI